ncbi:MAG: alpha-mannosidase [Anaerolineae bacterium]
MQKHYELTRQRVRAFAAALHALLYPERVPVRVSAYAAPGRITFAEALTGDYYPIEIGHRFGPPWSTHWCRAEIAIPADWAGREVHLLWDSSSEACVWQDGEPLQGLTGSNSGWAAEPSQPLRNEYPLTRQAAGGEQITLYIEVACNGLFGLSGQPEWLANLGLLRQAEIAVFDREAWDLLWDFQVVADMACELPINTPRGGQALWAANTMVNLIDPQDRTTWPAAREVAGRFLAARNGDGQHNLSAVGHAHIDTAWLWPLAETRRKCIRTFATAVRYMADYPDYRFACSQAQQYAWVKEMAPGLYERIKAQVAAGRFIPAGGTWVEMDCNIPAGESLVRQFLYAQRFFRQEFGVTCRELWLPDAFGYSAQLPQIMRLTGIRYFLTTKLSWNQFNKLPANTFLWEGLDGTRVLTHCPPLDTYNALATVGDVLRSSANFRDHERARESYLVFGLGDGGGGPTLAMLEQLRRMKDVDGLPRVEMRSPEAFFQRCEADIQEPTVWSGELYLELHRGTYTTQARIKRDNRRCELLLRDVEFLSAIGSHLGRLAYPGSELERLWKLVLLNQFHDIIPGSSIAEVYRDSAAQHAEVLAVGAQLRRRAVDALLAEADGDNLYVINTLGVPRVEVVALPAGIPAQQVGADGQPLGIVTAPALGYAVLSAAAGGAGWGAGPSAEANPGVQVVETQSGFVLENSLIRAVFGRGGGLLSLVDKRVGRECIAAGATGNRFVLFDDHPANWDAWDVDIFHLEKRRAVAPAQAARVVEAGPLRAAIQFLYQLSPASTLAQTVSLTALSPRLDFATQVAWHESHQFLKVEFPLALRASEATYEIQYGYIRRPTHWNTAWDMARFEVPAQRWADLAEPDFGVALLNDSKYGYAVHDNVMRLSLLRSPKEPDPEADMGDQTFRYALLPHPGTPQQADVTMEAYRFNVPLLVGRTAAEPATVSFFNVDTPAIVIDWVKKAEDSDALIVRLYEACGTHARGRLTSPLPVHSAALCNLLEEEEAPLAWQDGGTTLDLRPFQIVTLKLAGGQL